MKLQIGTDQIQLEYNVADVGEHSGNVVHLRGQNSASWHYELTSTASTDPVLLLPLDGSRLYLAYGFDLLALNVHTGAVEWQRHFDEPIWAGHLSSGGYILLHLELSIVCLDAQGRQLWQHNQGDIIVGLIVKDDYIIVQDFAGRNSMIDRFTGQLLTPVMP
jgi:outer membrane protein assembly factor BamB